MNDKQRIAELEKKLAQLEPEPPPLVIVNKRKQKVVGRIDVIGKFKSGKIYFYKGRKVTQYPIIEVEDAE